MSEPVTAVCRCGHRTTNAVRTLSAILWGVLVQWRCEKCGDLWWTR